MSIYKKCLVGILVIAIGIGVLPITNVQAATKMSKKEIKKYSQIMNDEQYIEDAMMCQSGGFLVYDINNDGRKELIVDGPVGIMHLFETVVYSYDGQSFHKSVVDGELIGVSGKGIFTRQAFVSMNSPDYGEHNSVYKLNASGQLEEKIREMEDSNSGTEYYSLSNGNLTAISEKKYKKQLNTYEFKSVACDYRSDIRKYATTRANIKKYIR